MTWLEPIAYASGAVAVVVFLWIASFDRELAFWWAAVVWPAMSVLAFSIPVADRDRRQAAEDLRNTLRFLKRRR